MYINLTNNLITDRGAIALINSLKVNEVVHTINLEGILEMIILPLFTVRVFNNEHCNFFIWESHFFFSSLSVFFWFLAKTVSYQRIVYINSCIGNPISKPYQQQLAHTPNYMPMVYTIHTTINITLSRHYCTQC